MLGKMQRVFSGRITPACLLGATVFLATTTPAHAHGITLGIVAILLGSLALQFIAIPAVILLAGVFKGRRMRYLVPYILFLAACALLLALATEMTAGAALIASAAAITNTGPAPGLVHANGPDYADLPDWARALLAMTMLAGRMELLTLLTLLNPAYWRH